jgi:hypothetical protein
MPFRKAHYAFLLLVPLIAFAFLPGYFGQLRDAPFALHAHGIAAMLWLGLVWLQAWSTGKDRLALHRTTGLAMFVLVPLFVAGGLLAMQGVVALAAAKSDPFHITYGPRLMLADAMSIAAFLILVTTAIVHRRRVWTHAGAMLATAVLVLPPIVGRLPLLPHGPFFGVPHIAAELELGQMSGVVLGAMLAIRYPRAARPFGFAAIVIAVESLLLETFGRTAAWEGIIFRLIGVRSVLLALVGLAVGAVPIWWAWQRGKARAVATLRATVQPT